MKILFVDDDQHMRRLCKEELEEEGYIVVTADSGAEALRVFDEHSILYEPFDLISLDILMPDIDGIKLLRIMKEKEPLIPVIMFTAYDYRDDFASWASEAFIVKSAELSEYKEAIKKLTTRGQKA